jgi:phosphate transport system substrate-binding protein
MRYFVWMASCVLLASCGSKTFENDYVDNSPTSGKLKVFCDEGLKAHILNQALTFENQYHNSKIEVEVRSDAEAVNALYLDSCKAIVISRELSAKEKETFASKTLNPRAQPVAYSGVALITNVNTKLDKLTLVQLQQLLLQPFVCTDSIDANCKISVVFESDHSSVVHYLKDSVIKGKPFSQNCSALKNTMEVINHVLRFPNTVGFIDFAWLSDRDDSLAKAVAGKLKFVPLGKGNGAYYEPNQSSFKTSDYPLTRKVYVYTQAPAFSLAQGFQAFVSGAKGQMTFLKQGLLPYTQQERNVHVNLEQH